MDEPLYKTSKVYYGLDDRSKNPGGGWEIFSTSCPYRLRGPPSLLSNGYQSLFPWG